VFTTLLFKVLKCQLRKRVHFLAEIFTKYPTLTGSLDIIDIDFWNGQFYILKGKTCQIHILRLGESKIQHLNKFLQLAKGLSYK